MKGYSVRDVAAAAGLSPAQVRTYARTGFIDPERGPRGALRFSFQDVVVLRTAKELMAAKVPARKIRASLRKLREQLPSGRPITAVRIAAQGERIIVQDQGTAWNPEDGQVLFDFAVSDLASRVAPIAQRNIQRAREDDEEMSAEDWYALGCDLEMTNASEARDAYRRAVELDPFHADAHVNLGRLLHEEGAAPAAEAHYRIALEAEPDHATAAYDLGVALEDMKRPREAILAYRHALEIDPDLADAHYNLAGLFEQLGRKQGAIRHLKAYRSLIAGRRDE
ncbi:MAG TPA: tetratricopeptide repeat protein [Thermoanaerobaculia bacterium]|nr:tetratricopeptide repeat protein [Thermoanaerobaculia bacterium]